MKFFHKNNFKFKKVIYPIIVAIFIIVGIFVFVYSVSFLSGAINKSFFVDNEIVESKMIKIDLDNLTKIASKLNIQLGETSISVFSSSSSSSQFSLSTSSVSSASTTTSVSSVASSSPIVELNKKLVKISILNGTKTKGLAVGLKDIMTKDGFIISKTGNVTEVLGTTTIKIKIGKKDYLPMIKESVFKKYRNVEDKEMDETGEYDIVIIIGGK